MQWWQRTKRVFLSGAFVSVLALGALTPTVSHAAGLGAAQINAIISLLTAFNVSDSVLANVALALGNSGTTSTTTTSTPPSQPLASSTLPARPSTIGSPYPSSSLGYDLSFNTQNYPQIPFGFAVVGATAGKSFTHNPRMASEFSWARLSSVAAPTIYLNLNAPFGSSAAGINVTTPTKCTTPFGAATTSSMIGGTYPEPTLCAGYNYGYNAAKNAYEYAQSQKYVSSKLWWLDVEVANSWAPETAVNDQVIQGAIDYLNQQGIRVGIYSVPFMWKEIAGDSFSPTESLNGASTTVPTWFPIGINNQVGAINACLNRRSFISGSPVWVIQYELDHTSVDQNIAC